MKLLEEKGLRNKIINECIKKENEIDELQEYYLRRVDNEKDISIRLESMIIVKELGIAIMSVSDLRMRLMQLLDNEKVE